MATTAATAMTTKAFTERRQPPPATLWDDEDDSDYEFGDDQVRRIIIVTQATPVLGSKDRFKHEGYDRTGDGETRVKMSQEISKVIDDGLFYYEQDLWENNNRKRTLSNSSTSISKVGLISQEAFDRLTNKPATNNKRQLYVPPPP